MHSLQIIPLGELLEGGVKTLLFVFRDSETEVQGPAYLDKVYMCGSWRVLCSVIDLLNSIAPPTAMLCGQKCVINPTLQPKLSFEIHSRVWWTWETFPICLLCYKC